VTSTEPSPVPDHERYNHTIRYQRELISALPGSARSALDVGCGEGLASRELAARGLRVMGIDADAASITRATAQSTEGVKYVAGDVMTDDLPRAGFDVVFAAAVVHHLDLEPALKRLSELVAPGGRLAIVGLAASSMPLDAARDLASVVADRVQRIGKPHWEHGSPTVWPPPHTYDQVQAAASPVLPGNTFRRRLYWRYTLTWDAPLERS
jgi:2-polyprenyl-3-methyl-5-hydroxy-6-metoxy-1,4-benzoquinol methylase